MAVLAGLEYEKQPLPVLLDASMTAVGEASLPRLSLLQVMIQITQNQYLLDEICGWSHRSFFGNIRHVEPYRAVWDHSAASFTQ